MRKRLSYVSPLQVGKVLAVLYGLLSLIFLPFFLLITFLAPTRRNGPPGFLFGGIFMVIFPFIYAVMGFVFGIIAAAIYNLVAKWTGGIEFIVTDVPGDGTALPMSAAPPSSAY
jgi:hypothetical protein